MGETIHLDLEEICDHILNRPPLLMIESVDVIPGEMAKATIHLKPDDWFFPCHFPGNPMMPGVLQLESMFQTGILTVKTLPGMKRKLSNISKVREVSFMQNIVPPCDIVVNTKVVRPYRRGITEIDGIIESNGCICSKATYVLAIPEDMVLMK